MGLGRGLASLISRKESEVSADDMLERIDSMETEDDVVVPKKPNVTTISLEPEMAAVHKVSVQETQEEEEVETAPEPTIETPAVQEQAEEENDEVEEPEEVAIPEASPQPEAEPETSQPQATSEDDIWDKHEGAVQHISIGDIRINPLQPRRTFDPNEMQDLQESIAQNGILQPLVVHRLPDGNFELIAGERRLRAARALKWDKVPCVIRREVKSDQSRLVYALIENVQRENLNPIEEARAYHQLNTDFGLTHEEIGQRVGKSRVGVTNIVRVLQLPAEIQRGMTEGKITMGHAKAILMIPDEEKQIRFYHHLVEEGLTVRKAEIRARRIQRTMNITDPARLMNRVKKNPMALKYGPPLEDRYGYNASVRYVDEKNIYEVVFRASGAEELEQLAQRLLGEAPVLSDDVDRDVIED